MNLKGCKKYLLFLCLILNCSTISKINQNYDIFEAEIIYLNTFKIINNKYYSGYIKTDLGAKPFNIRMDITFLHVGSPKLVGLVYRETYLQYDYNDYQTYHLYLPKKIIDKLDKIGK